MKPEELIGHTVIEYSRVGKYTWTYEILGIEDGQFNVNSVRRNSGVIDGPVPYTTKHGIGIMMDGLEGKKFHKFEISKQAEIQKEVEELLK